ncbi:MAG: hypothetical protein K0R52_145 [Alphaproteobacteria bacterium]|nr:hypothetical protein [Alphaproteobacteria bacterium]
MRFIKSLFSFESSFVLWLFSYQYKNAFEIFTSPDITVLLTLVLIPWGLFLWIKTKPVLQLRSPVILVFLGLSSWFIASSFWSPSEAYKLQKTLCYSLYTIPGFLMDYLIISRDPERLKRLMGAFLLFSTVVLAESYHVFFINGLVTISDILNNNYLVTGQTLGVGLLVLVPYTWFNFMSQKADAKTIPVGCNPAITEKLGGFHNLWLWSLLLGSLFFYALMNLGGRGPVVATGAALAIFYGMKCWQSPTSTQRTLLGVHFCTLALLCTLGYFMLNELFDHTGSHFQQRLAPLMTGQIDEAVNERFIYYQSAFLTFLNHPFVGVGFGGWPISHGLGDVSLHPHNIFLEILSETGLVGLAGFMALLYFVFRNLKLQVMFSTPERTSLALLTTFSFLSAQKTGDLHDNLLLFVMLSLCAGLQR